MDEKVETHIEKIRCPKCGTIQNGTVEHLTPFYSYVHECCHCGYWITESEWEKVEE